MPELRRELGLRDITLFALASILGTRWIPAAAHAGPGAVVLWIAAAVFLMVPLATAVAALSVKYPGPGGIYLWTRQDFGPWHGFLCFWLYWVGIAFWFPSAAMFYMSTGLRALSPSLDQRALVVAASIAAVWIALGTNLVGLRIGKWTQNLGALSGWVLCAGLAVAASVVYRQRGSATPLVLWPKWNWDTVAFWSTIAYALTGIELAAMMGAEIRDPKRTLPLAAAIASLLAAGFYIAATLAVVVLVPAAQVSEMSGLAQAATALGAGWIGPVVALLVMGSAVGQFGGLGTATSRMPMTVGFDNLLPAAFARVHPEWRTPHVAILTLGVVSSALLIAMQAGDTMRAAYQELVSLMVIGGFLPFVYLFASAWKARRRVAASSGMAVTLIALVCSVVPTAEVTHVALFELKLALGTAAMVGSARWLYQRAASRATLR